MRVVRFSFLVLTLLAATLSAGAKPEGPRLRNGSIGFNAQFHNRFWTPLTVDIENPGPAQTFRVIAEARGEKSGQLVQFTRDVWVPSNAYRQVEFPVFPDLRIPTDPQANKIQSPFMLHLTDGAAFEYDKLEILGNPIPEEAFTVLVADSRFVSYLMLKEATVGPEKRPVGRAVGRPDNLPRRPLDYRSFDAIVLGDLGEAHLSPLQRAALIGWVRAGGHLLVVPGTVMPDAELGEWLPAKYHYPREVETLPVIAPGVRFPNGVRFCRLEPVGEETGMAMDGRGMAQVIRGDADRPIAVTRMEGLGRVTVLAFDAGAEDFQRWPGARDFLTGLLNEPVLLPFADRILERSATVEGLLSSLAGIKVLARGGLLVYLAVVVGVLLGVIGIARFTRLPEFGWAVAAALAIGGSVAAVVLASAWKSQPSPFLTQLFVLTARSGAAEGNLQAALGLFSPTEHSYEIAAATDAVSLRPGPSALTPPERFQVDYEARLALPEFRVRADDIRLMYGRGPVATAIPQVSLEFGADGARLRVANPGDIPLADGFLKYNRLVVPVGDLAAGGELRRDNIRDATGAFSSRLVRDDRDELRDRLRTVFFPEPVFSLQRTFAFEERRFYSLFRGREPRPVFYAWSDKSPAALAELTPPVARRAEGLWAIETAPTFAGTELLVPRGVMQLRLRTKAAATSDAGEGRYFGTRPTQLLLEFALPADWPDLVATEATVHLEFRGSAFTPVVSVAPRDWDGGEDDTAVGRFTPLSGGPRYRIADPARFYNPTRRSLVVALTIEGAASGSEQQAENFLLGLTNWQVRELEVEMRGTTRRLATNGTNEHE